MEQLTQEQIRLLNTVLKEGNLLSKFNDLLKEAGAEDLQIVSFRVQPIALPQTKKLNLSSPSALAENDHLINKANMRIFPPVCIHGKPMVQQCTTKGSCRWVCDH